MVMRGAIRLLSIFVHLFPNSPVEIISGGLSGPLDQNALTSYPHVILTALFVLSSFIFSVMSIVLSHRFSIPHSEKRESIIDYNGFLLSVSKYFKKLIMID